MKKSNETSDRPKVTVLMAVYDGEKYLAEAIDSILSQTFTDFEFLIIDDGSTDQSGEIVKSFDDARIRFVHNGDNLGLTKCLNKGLQIARGEYIARMDADDVSLPERLATQAVFLDEHSEIGVVGCAVQVIDSRGSPMHVVRPPTTPGLLLWSLCFGTSLAHPSVVFRKEVVERVGGYNDALLANQDRDLWERLSSVTCLVNLPDVLLLYRIHPSSISHTHSDIQKHNSAEAGQRMMSRILEYKVPFEVCYNIRLGRFQTADDAAQVVGVIHSLYDVFMTNKSLSELERRAIRKTAAIQLIGLAWRWMHKAKMQREFLALAFRLNPLIVAKNIVVMLVRKACRVIAPTSQ